MEQRFREMISGTPAPPTTRGEYLATKRWLQRIRQKIKDLQDEETPKDKLADPTKMLILGVTRGLKISALEEVCEEMQAVIYAYADQAGGDSERG